jgi:hypothetical protein
MKSFLMVSYGASSIINNNFLEMHLTPPYKLKKNKASDICFKQLILTAEVVVVKLSQQLVDSI